MIIRNLLFFLNHKMFLAAKKLLTLEILAKKDGILKLLIVV